jgi:hypothetical protein
MPGRPDRITLSLFSIFVPLSALAQELPGLRPGADVAYSPHLQKDLSNRVFFGGTHLHTAFSADAGLASATTTPDDAYHFAKGQEVISSQGVRAMIRRTRDFLVVTDHAENLGIAIAQEEEKPILDDNEWNRTLAEAFAPRTIEATSAACAQWFGAVKSPAARTR